MRGTSSIVFSHAFTKLLRKQRIKKVSEPQIKKNGWIPRSEQQCGNCDSYIPLSQVQGQCVRNPPVAILIGMHQRPPTMIGQQPPPPEPVVNGYFCPVSPNRWCKKWEPKVNGDA